MLNSSNNFDLKEISRISKKINDLTNDFNNLRSVISITDTFRELIADRLFNVFKFEAEIFKRFIDKPETICAEFIHIEKNEILPAKKRLYVSLINYYDSPQSRKSVISQCKYIAKRVMELIDAKREGTILIKFDESDLKKAFDKIYKTLKEIDKYLIGTKDDLALILQGGGIKGLAHIGALEVLKGHYNFTRFAGTSAGAIVAILLAAGFDISELRNIIYSTSFSDFKDSNLARGLFRLRRKRGIYEAKKFRDWLDNILARKLNSYSNLSLEGLKHPVEVYACTRKKTLIFDSTNESMKKYAASYAARCSMAIPIVFTPEYYEGELVYDGGLKHNLPIQVFLKNHPHINFLALSFGPEVYSFKPLKNTLLGLVGNIISAISSSTKRESIAEYEDKTVNINTDPISTMKFEITNKEKEYLLEAGRLAAWTYLIKKGKVSPPEDYDTRIKLLERTRQLLKK